MKNLLILITALLIFSTSAFSTDSRYGGCFTPKDSLKVLVVFVGFGDNDTLMDVGGWPPDQDFPDRIANSKTFYSDFSMFDSPIDSERDVENISRWYYEMSKFSGHPLKVIADCIRINISGSPTDFDAASNYEILENSNRDKILDALSALHNDINNNFNWADYDNRINFPNYKNDYSNYNSPDNKVDYIAIIFRWKSSNPNSATGYTTFAGGFRDSFQIGDTINQLGGKSRDGLGYVQVRGDGSMFHTFIHEVGHYLYNGSHYGGANNVGFKGGAMWGAMNLGDYHAFNVANANERYILGWSEVEANGVASKLVYPPVDTTARGFKLRDYTTTGDMVCIEMPNESGNATQRLWIENHKQISMYDKRNAYITDKFGDTLPAPVTGIYAFIEIGIGDDCYLPLHSKGNYDYRFDSTFLSPQLWNSTYNAVTEGAANPYSGVNRWQKCKVDANNDNVFEESTTDRTWIVIRNGDTTYDFLGIDAAFEPGQKLGMFTNPRLGTSQYLNGIQVTFYEDSVKVEYNKVDLEGEYRMASRQIVLQNITGNMNTTDDNRPDMRIKTGAKLTIDRDTNTTAKGLGGGYYTPTMRFLCWEGAYFRMDSSSRVNLLDSTRLLLKSSSKLEIAEDAILFIDCSSKLTCNHDGGIVTKDNIDSFPQIVRLGTGIHRGRVVWAVCGDDARRDTVDCGMQQLCMSTDSTFIEKIIVAPDSAFVDGAKWYLGNDTTEIGVGGSIEISNFIRAYLDTDSISDTIQIRLETIDGYVFIWDVEITLSPDFFELALQNHTFPSNVVVSEDGKSALITLDNGHLHQTIPLPSVLDSACNYEVVADSSNFTEYPHIDNGVLYFTFQEDLCEDVNFTLNYYCDVIECPDEFIMNINNTDCIDACAGMEINHWFVEAPFSLSSDGSRYVEAKTTNGQKIISMDIKDLYPAAPNLLSNHIHRTLRNGGLDSVVASIPCNNCTGDTVHKYYEVCILLDDSITNCCDTIAFSYICYNPKKWFVDVMVNPAIDFGGSIINACYVLDSIAVPLLSTTPLRINLCDSYGNLMFNIHSGLVSQLEGEKSFNSNGLLPGIYWVSFQFDSDTMSVMFIKQ